MIIENKAIAQLTSERATGFSPWCLTGGEVVWSDVTNLKKSPDLGKTLGLALTTLGVKRCFTTRSGLGAERVVDNNILNDSYGLTEDVTAYRNLNEPANALWLDYGDAFVELTTCQMLFGASGGGLYLAGRYSSWMASKIADAFEDKEIPLEHVHVTALFAPPVRGKSNISSFERACFDLGIGYFEEHCVLPENGPFPYTLNQSVNGVHSLGIVARV